MGGYGENYALEELRMNAPGENEKDIFFNLGGIADGSSRGAEFRTWSYPA